MGNKLSIVIQIIFLCALFLDFYTITIADDKVIKITDSRFKNINKKNEYGQTTLHIEVFNGNQETVISLIENHADVNAVDFSRWTPLHVAVYRGYKDIATLLIDKDADVDALDSGGRTPLYLAIYKGYYNLTSLLIQHGARVDVTDNIGWTPMHLAAYQSRKDIIELLKKHGASLSKKTETGWTSLHLALSKADQSLISILIQHININITGRYEWTPLHLAYYIGNTDLANFLIEKGANTNAVDENGQTPFQITPYYSPYTTDNVFTSLHHKLTLSVDTSTQHSHLAIGLSKLAEEKYLREHLQFNRREIRTIKDRFPHIFTHFTRYKLESAFAYLEDMFQFNKKEIKNFIIQNPEAFANFIYHQINFTMRELEKSLQLTESESKRLIEQNFSALVHTRAPQIKKVISFMERHNNKSEIKERLMQNPQALSDQTVQALRQVMPFIDDYIGVEADKGTQKEATWIPFHWLLFTENIEQILPLIQSNISDTAKSNVGYADFHIPLHWAFYEDIDQFIFFLKDSECIKTLSN